MWFRSSKNRILLIVLISILSFVTLWILQDQKDIPGENREQKLRVLATTSMLASLTRDLGGDMVDVSILIPSGVDPHSYELVKKDISLIMNADLIIKNGLGLEHSNSIVRVLDQHHNVLDVGDFLYRTSLDRIIFVDDIADPHIWLDLSLWADIVDYIAEELMRSLPRFRSQLEMKRDMVKARYIKEHKSLVDKMSFWRARNDKLVSAHTGLNYFVRAYLMPIGGKLREYYMAPEGFAPDSEVSIEDIRNTALFIINNQVSVVFPEYGINRRILDKVIEVARLLSGQYVTMAREELWTDSCPISGDTATVITLLRHNIDSIMNTRE